jgi:hypothetical protein
MMGTQMKKIPWRLDMFKDRIDAIKIDKGYITISLKRPFMFFGGFVVEAASLEAMATKLDMCEELDEADYDDIINMFF